MQLVIIGTIRKFLAPGLRRLRKRRDGSRVFVAAAAAI
jgi:hypothetical protein